MNSAGCGALLKDYGHLLGGESPRRRSAAKVRDVSELLAAAGPRPGAPLELDVAYDAPCHLQHAQRVHDAPLAVLRAIPGLRLQLLPGSDQCCGSAGHLLRAPARAWPAPCSTARSRPIADANPRPGLVATGNPGCLMQIGAGLLAARLPIGVAHPVELLDWSYERAGGMRAQGRGGAGQHATLMRARDLVRLCALALRAPSPTRLSLNDHVLPASSSTSMASSSTTSRSTARR